MSRWERIKDTPEGELFFDEAKAERLAQARVGTAEGHRLRQELAELVAEMVRAAPGACARRM